MRYPPESPAHRVTTKENTMHVQSLFKGSRFPAILAFGSLVFAACNTDSGNDPNNNNDERAVIAGRVQGDAEASGSGSSSTSGWENTVITTHTLNADGSLSAAKDSGNANADGTFSLETAFEGSQDLVLRARREGKDWWARFKDTLEAGETSNSRPMNLESSLETAVWIELQKSAEGRAVHSSEVTVAIDAQASAKAQGDFRGAESARNNLVAALAASIRAGADARRAFLAAADSQYNARRSDILASRAQAEAQLEASLIAAGNDTGAARGAQRVFVNAYVKAYTDASIQRTNLARSSEAAYQASVRASAQISDSARTAFARNYARILAVASDTAMRHEFRNAGAAQARLELVADAGARFRSSVDTASTRARIDSAMARFRSDVKAAYNNTTDTTFNVWTAITSQVTVGSFLSGLSTSINTALAASVSGETVGQVNGQKHAEARADLVTRFSAVNSNRDQAKAAANVGAFLWVYGSN
jgi:hypothetical protein